MSTLKQLQGEVAIRMRRGDTFASVEVEVIDPSELSDAEKGALWLYGWSFVHWRRQRREAMAQIDVLAGSPVPKRPKRKHLHLARSVAALGAEPLIDTAHARVAATSILPPRDAG